MTTKVLIPTALRAYTDSQDAVELPGSTVGEVLENLARRYDELRRHLYDDAGKLRAYVNVYVNDEDFRHLQRERTVIGSGDVISIVPAIAGGRPRRGGALALAPARRETRIARDRTQAPKTPPNARRSLES